MVTTLIIALREFLEVFLIIGVFFGISRKFGIRREKEILAASTLGIIFALALPILVFALGARASAVFTEKNADLIEGYLMVFSGFFIAYVVFTLHKFFALNRSKAIISAHQKLQKNIFDVALFGTIVFFIIREGFEIALFTATTALFSKFMENFTGLILGFTISIVFGLLTFLTYIRFPVGRVFKITEYFIILLGAVFVKNGVSELAAHYMRIDISTILPIRLSFIPNADTFIGHLFKNVVGLESNFSVMKLAIMGAYITFIYFLFLKKRQKTV